MQEVACAHMILGERSKRLRSLSHAMSESAATMEMDPADPVQASHSLRATARDAMAVFVRLPTQARPERDLWLILALSAAVRSSTIVRS